MAWQWTGNKPLPEPISTMFYDTIWRLQGSMMAIDLHFLFNSKKKAKCHKDMIFRTMLFCDVLHKSYHVPHDYVPCSRCVMKCYIKKCYFSSWKTQVDTVYIIYFTGTVILCLLYTFHLTLNMRGQSYLGLTRSISLLLMPWLLTSPGHQQPWYLQCGICRSWSYLRKDFKYCTCVISMWSNGIKCKYMFMFPLQNLAR